MKKCIACVILLLVCIVIVEMAALPGFGKWQLAAYGVMCILLAWIIVEWMDLYGRRGEPVKISDLKKGIWYTICLKADYIQEANLGFRTLILVCYRGCNPIVVKLKNDVPSDAVRLCFFSIDGKTAEVLLGRSDDTSFTKYFTV